MLTTINFFTSLVVVFGLGKVVWEDRDVVLADGTDWIIGTLLGVLLVGNAFNVVATILSLFGA